MSSEELSSLRLLGRKQRIERGQTFVWEGDDAIVVANVISGMLKVSMNTADGREQIVGILFPSDFVGRPFGSQNTSRVTALSDAELCVFPRSSFDSFARRHPDLEHKLLQRTLDELDRARAWMLLLGKKSAGERIATLLLDMSHRLGETGCEADGISIDSFDLPLNRQQIGDILGLTIETVSRQLTRLKDDGIITLPDRRRVTIQDRNRLQEIAFAA